MQEIDATFDELSELVKTVNRAGTRIEELLDDLAGQLRSLTEKWTGSASEGFQATLSQWFKAADDLRDTVRRFEKILNTTQANYRNALVTNTRMWPTRSR
jgi:early secretory antigenic target protein ESAT-6